MQITVKHRPSYAIAYAFLEVGESIHVERDAMAVMSDGFAVSAGFGGGGARRALVRRAFGGEDMLFGNYRATVHGAYIGVTPRLPGDVEVLDLDGNSEWNVEQGAVLAYADTVEVGVSYTGIRGVLMKEGVSMLRIAGSGAALIASYGAIDRFELGSGESLIVDSGHLVGVTGSVGVEVGMLGGFATSQMTGEGLVARLTGPGSILVQSRAEQQMRSWLFPDRAQNG